MKKIDLEKMKIGIRLRVFREIVGLEINETARGMDISPAEIQEMEEGSVYPKITYLSYLNESYGLNINWIMGRVGGMFDDHAARHLETLYASTHPVNDRDPRFSQYMQLLDLLEIPVIEDAVMAVLQEIKALLKKNAGEREGEN